MEHLKTSPTKRIVFLLMAGHVTLLVLLAFFRILDNDEGYYLLAAQNVAHGMTLYRDFFYPQGPYLPYLLAPFSGNGFATIYLSRLAGVLASTVGMILFWMLLSDLSHNVQVRVALFSLYCTSAIILIWHSPVKTFAWTDPLLIASFFMLVKYIRTQTLWPLALSGGLLALAINIRYPLLPVALLWGFWIGKEKKALPLLLFFGSIVFVSIPSLTMLLSDSKRFIFDNLLFHGMRSPGVDSIQALIDRGVVAAKLLPNLCILFPIAVVILGVRERKLQRDERTKHSSIRIACWAVLTALVIAVTYLFPNPVHQQYFIQAIPFALLSGCTISRLIPSNRYVSIVLSLLYVGMLIPYFVVFVGGVRATDRKGILSDVKQTALTVQAECTEGDSILSETPIIPVVSTVGTGPEFAFIGYDFSMPLTDDQKRCYHLPVNGDIANLLAAKKLRCFVVQDEPDSGVREIANLNYREQQRFGCYVIFVPR